MPLRKKGGSLRGTARKRCDLYGVKTLPEKLEI
jgi:hypothetical protein